MDYIRQEVKTFLVDRVCDSCYEGKMQFLREHEELGVEHECDTCHSTRIYSEKYPLIEYERVGDIEYV